MTGRACKAVRRPSRHALRIGLVWAGLAIALMLGTTPVWRGWISGSNPTLDDALRVICRG